MSRISLPETVKTAFAGISPGTGAKAGARFPVNLGPNEVMVLLSFFYNWYGSLAAGSCSAWLGLWKKTDTDPTTSLDIAKRHTDMIWHLEDSTEFVTESLKSSGSGHIILPWPIVLIRPPRLVGSMSTFTVYDADMRLYYLVQEVSDEDLAELMVKDHA